MKTITILWASVKYHARKIKEFFVAAVAIKQKHGFEDRTAGHTRESAGVSYLDIFCVKLVDKVAGKLFCRIKNVAVACYFIRAHKSPKGIFSAPDVPVAGALNAFVKHHVF